VQICQIEVSINTAEHVVRGHVVVEIEGVKQSGLLAVALSHHAGLLPSLRTAFEAAASGDLDRRIAPHLGARRDELKALGSNIRSHPMCSIGSLPPASRGPRAELPERFPQLVFQPSALAILPRPANDDDAGLQR
jgi:hypothetical protein